MQRQFTSWHFHTKPTAQKRSLIDVVHNQRMTSSTILKEMVEASQYELRSRLHCIQKDDVGVALEKGWVYCPYYASISISYEYELLCTCLFSPLYMIYNLHTSYTTYCRSTQDKKVPKSTQDELRQKDKEKKVTFAADTDTTPALPLISCLLMIPLLLLRKNIFHLRKDWQEQEPNE